MGKKTSNKTAAVKASTAASKAGAAAGKAATEESSGHQTGDWAKSLITEKDINELKSQELLNGME